MLRFGVCFCKPGIMSQCDPKGQDVKLCDFYNKHSFAPQCTHLVFDRNCDSYKAQMFGYYPNGNPDSPIVEETEIDLLINHVVEDYTEPEKSCHVCIDFPCSVIVSQQRTTPGGIAHGVMLQLAERCASYIYGGDV